LRAKHALVALVGDQTARAQALESLAADVQAIRRLKMKIQRAERDELEAARDGVATGVARNFVIATNGAAINAGAYALFVNASYDIAIDDPSPARPGRRRAGEELQS
jgi:hypothetical protein